MPGQLANLDPLAADGMELFDQFLLTLDTPQGEMPIAR